MTPNDPIVIRPASAGDIGMIEEIARQSCRNPWNFRQIEEELTYDFAYLFFAEYEGEPVGFADMHIAGGAAHLNEIAVRGIFRRRGVGDRLMHACIETAMRRGCGVLGLEVREQNPAARALYKSLGFDTVGIRPHFYRNPPDSAVVMRLLLQACDPIDGSHPIFLE